MVRAGHAPIPADVGLRLGLPFAGRLPCGRSTIAVLPDPDGKHMVVVTAEGLLRLAWASGELVASHEEPDGNSYLQAAWMPEAQSLLVACRTSSGFKTELRFHDPRTFELLRTVPSPSSNVSGGLQVLADGTIATLGGRGIVVLDPETAKVRREVRCNGRISRFAYTPDGHLAVIVTDKGKLTVFANERATATLPGFQKAIAISSDGRRFAAISSRDKHVVIHDTSSLEVIARIKPPERHGRTPIIGHLAFTPDGRTLLAVGQVIGLVDAENGGEFRVIHEPDSTSNVHPAISMDGRLAAVANGQTALVIDLVDRVEVRPPAVGHESSIITVHGTRDGRRVVSAAWDARAFLWDVERRAVCRDLDVDRAGMRAMRFSPDDRLLAVAFANRRVALVDPETGATVRELGGPQNSQPGRGTVQLVFSPDGARLACAGLHSDGGHVWEVATGQHLVFAHPPKATCTAIAFSPDGEQIVTGGVDKVTRLWNARTGELVKELTGHKESVTCVAFTPDGGTLVSGSHDGAVTMWDPITGIAREVLADTPFSGSFYDLSPDGKCLLGAAIDGVCLVPLGVGGRRTVLEGHFGERVETATFLASGGIVTGGSDGSLFVWEPSAVSLAETPPR